ncbi:hypothetical protein [Planosporangium sp. 12N6]|uniref:hypothetical protein n=1 Tax=Planosporangium spinosum TaxID=3402278 RepID=UPI003CE8787B
MKHLAAGSAPPCALWQRTRAFGQPGRTRQPVRHPDDRDAWGGHRPSARQENEFIERHGFGEYRRWFPGADDEEPEDSKDRYTFPYGDFERVHRCGVFAAESRAGQYKYTDIEVAAAHLRGMPDAPR